MVTSSMPPTIEKSTCELLQFVGSLPSPQACDTSWSGQRQNLASRHTPFSARYSSALHSRLQIIMAHFRAHQLSNLKSQSSTALWSFDLSRIIKSSTHNRRLYKHVYISSLWKEAHKQSLTNKQASNCSSKQAKKQACRDVFHRATHRALTPTITGC